MVGIVFLFLLLQLTLIPSRVQSIIDGIHSSKFYLMYPTAAVVVDNGIFQTLRTRWCSGALITHWHVLTAATCCDYEYIKHQRVRVGSLDSRDGGQQIPVRDFRIVPNEMNANLYMSLCVLKLYYPPMMVQPFILSDAGQIRPQNLVVAGFGSTVRNKRLQLSKDLLMGVINEQDLQECMKYGFMEFLQDYPANYVNHIMCTKSDQRMSLYDHGAPIVDERSNRIYGVALTYYPNYAIVDEEKRNLPQLMFDVRKHRAGIDRMILEMEDRFDL